MVLGSTKKEAVMVALGIAAASVAAFVVSSIYYALVTPLERRALGERALDRGRPGAGKVVAELVRTAVTASAFAWVATQAHRADLPGGLLLAVVLWVGLPVVLLSGSV